MANTKTVTLPLPYAIDFDECKFPKLNQNK